MAAGGGGVRRALLNVSRPRTFNEASVRLASQLTARLEKFLLRRKEPCLPLFAELSSVGAESEGSSVSRSPRFDVLLVCDLPIACELVTTGPQRQFVTCEVVAPDAVPDEVRPLLTLGTNLSPNKFVRRTHSLLRASLSDLAKCEPGLQVDLSRQGRDIDVTASSGQLALSIRFLLCIRIQEGEVTSLLCPKQPRQPQDDVTEWQRYFGPQMAAKIATCDEKDGGCRVDVLRLLKLYAQRRSHYILNSFVLKTLLLEEEGKVKEENAWAKGKLKKRFEASLQSLQIVLKSGHLTHPFLKGENLLSDCPAQDLLRLWAAVKEDCQSGDLAKILCDSQ